MWAGQLRGWHLEDGNGANAQDERALPVGVVVQVQVVAQDEVGRQRRPAKSFSGLSGFHTSPACQHAHVQAYMNQCLPVEANECEAGRPLINFTCVGVVQVGVHHGL